MRILDEKNLSILWSWGKVEEDEMSTRFDENLKALFSFVEKLKKDANAFNPDDIKALAEEIQEVSSILAKSSANCTDLCDKLRVLCGEKKQAAPLGESPAEAKSLSDTKQFKVMQKYVGKRVIVTRTSLKHLQNKTVILEEVRGTKGIIRDGEDYWETPLSHLSPAPPSGGLASSMKGKLKLPAN